MSIQLHKTPRNRMYHNPSYVSYTWNETTVIMDEIIDECHDKNRLEGNTWKCQVSEGVKEIIRCYNEVRTVEKSSIDATRTRGPFGR